MTCYLEVAGKRQRTGTGVVKVRLRAALSNSNCTQCPCTTRSYPRYHALRLEHLPCDVCCASQLKTLIRAQDPESPSSAILKAAATSRDSQPFQMAMSGCLGTRAPSTWQCANLQQQPRAHRRCRAYLLCRAYLMVSCYLFMLVLAPNLPHSVCVQLHNSLAPSSFHCI